MDSTAGSPLDDAIAAYLQAVEAGEVPNRADLLSRHPELAAGLRDFFADFDRLDRQGLDLKLTTITADAIQSGSGGKVSTLFSTQLLGRSSR